MFYGRINNVLAVAFSKEIQIELQSRIRLLQAGDRVLPSPTPEALAAIKAIDSRRGHVTIRARAGTGKTTVIEQIIKNTMDRHPEAKVRASTLHSFGMGAYAYWYKKAYEHDFDYNKQIDDGKVRMIAESLFVPPLDSIQDEDKKRRAVSLVGCSIELVKKAKLHGFGAFRPMPTDEDFNMLMDEFQIDGPEDDSSNNLDSVEYENVALPKAFALARRVLEANNKMHELVDFTDMIYLPLFLNVRFLWQDLILVDETQDLNPIQQEMVRRIAGNKGQCVFVGDDRQSIFGFAGADVYSMDTIQKVFNTEVLPLTCCFRCPEIVVKLAQEIVPDITPAPAAIEGEYWHIYEREIDGYEKLCKEVYDGDYIVCRTTAPLVGLCLKLIGKGIAATVRGKAIGEGLANLAEKIRARRDSRGKSIADAIDIYESKKTAKMNDENKVSAFKDRIAAVRAVSEDCDNWGQVVSKIKAMFSEVKDGELSTRSGVVLCTAHRAKGLQANNVYIICPELLPFPKARTQKQMIQEQNLKYVAITRAIKKLTFVHMAKGVTPYRFRHFLKDGVICSEEVAEANPASVESVKTVKEVEVTIPATKTSPAKKVKGQRITRKSKKAHGE